MADWQTWSSAYSEDHGEGRSVLFKKLWKSVCNKTCHMSADAMEVYDSKAEKLVQEALKIRSDSPPWQYLKTQGGVKMFYKQSPHFKGNMYKFETVLDFPHDVVYQIMKPSETTQERLSWDKSLKHYERLSTISEEVAVGLLVTPNAAWGLVSKREFVDMYVFKTFPNDEMKINEDYGEMCWIFAESIEWPSHPATKDCVRGINFPSGFAVVQNIRNPDQCFLELYTNCDIGGMLPRSIVETALPSQQVYYVESVKAEAKKRLAKK